MSKSIFIALLNPAISAIFAGGFFLLWRQQRDRHYIGVLAISFLAVAFGFLLQNVTWPPLVAASKLVSNALFLAGACAIAIGVLGRFRKRPPYVMLGLISLACMAVLAWFLFVVPDTGLRIFAINIALGCITLLVVAHMWNIPDKQFIERLLMLAFLADGINFLARPIIVVLIAGAPSEGDIFMSLYWISTSVSHAFFSVLLAMSLMTAIALDVIGKLQADALTDPLSGVLNRRGFEERGNALLAETDVDPVVLVLADLDYFKSINDGYGHASGDRVIAAFGNMLRDMAGQGPVVGRIGGEEFAVILPGRGCAQARLFAEDVQEAFSKVAIAGLPKGIVLTASFGVAERAENETLSTLLGRADRALYSAKDGGRNRVLVFTGGELHDSRRRATG